MLARENLADHKSLNERSNKLRQRLWKIRAKVILATGAIERPLIFNNNDRPGVMLLTLLKNISIILELDVEIKI